MQKARHILRRRYDADALRWVSGRRTGMGTVSGGADCGPRRTSRCAGRKLSRHTAVHKWLDTRLRAPTVRKGHGHHPLVRYRAGILRRHDTQ